MFKVKRGSFQLELNEPIETAVDGKVTKATTLVLGEPVKDSEYEAVALAQMITRAGFSVSKLFAGLSPQEDPKAEGGEIVPFHLQELPDAEKLKADTIGMIKVLKASDVDLKEFINTGKKLFTTRYSGAKRRICSVSTESGDMPLTVYLFDGMSFADKMSLVVGYCVFFDISSIGEPMTISSKQPVL